ncbi:hypothetical protein FAZ95_01310 [Trinickia violacea]|uniref:Uncharacterized protein n=1 Tax=Trinickia violacea TaxID=2571746 RepID=A0A4P8IMB4_9BURK|nr:hypothetical protein [Trinickia violacea]QCP47934.1 hypothetical protein FAZ95_01310 [Trinickia violacea]
MNPANRDFRIRIDEEAGKYAVTVQLEANGPWGSFSSGDEAIPGSQFKELLGSPYLSRHDLPDGVRPSKTVPVAALLVPGKAGFILMPPRWFQRNKETNVSYNAELIMIAGATYGGGSKPALLCRV